MCRWVGGDSYWAIWVGLNSKLKISTAAHYDARTTELFHLLFGRVGVT